MSGAYTIKLTKVPKGSVSYVWLDDKKEAILFEREGQLRLFSSICPHMGAQLCHRSENDQLVCPWHGLAFDLKTGNSNHHRYKRLLEYGVEQRGEEIVVQGKIHSE